MNVSKQTTRRRLLAGASLCPDMFCCRAVLLKLFMAGSKSGEADKMEHIAAILTNVTRLKAGRAVLLEPGRGFIEALVAQLKSSNLLRRQGCAAAFRNCCFSAEVRKSLSPPVWLQQCWVTVRCHQAHRHRSQLLLQGCNFAFHAKKVTLFAKLHA